MWSLIGHAALSETGVFSFPLHSRLSVSAGQQQTLEFLIFVFVVFIALGFSITLLTRHFHRQWSKCSLEPDGLLVIYRVQSWIRYWSARGLLVGSVLSSFLPSFQTLLVCASLTETILLHTHLHVLLRSALAGGLRGSPWAYLPKLVTTWRSEVSALVTCTIYIGSTVDLPECVMIPSQPQDLQLDQLLRLRSVSLFRVTVTGRGFCCRVAAVIAPRSMPACSPFSCWKIVWWLVLFLTVSLVLSNHCMGTLLLVHDKLMVDSDLKKITMVRRAWLWNESMKSSFWVQAERSV